MPSILIQLDEATARALNAAATAANRKRAEFVRAAIKRAIRDEEFARIRAGYLKQPDSAAEADDWSTAEEWKP